MNTHLERMEAPQAPREEGRLRLPWWLGACAFLAIAVFFLWEEHRAHLLGALPFLLLLACPLMHVFMHHGHGGSSAHERHDASNSKGGPS